MLKLNRKTMGCSRRYCFKNWFYLIEGFGPEVNYSNIEELSSFSVDVMNELERSGITGEDGSKVDHKEIFGPPSDSSIADSKNFVMCPEVSMTVRHAVQEPKQSWHAFMILVNLKKVKHGGRRNTRYCI